MNDARFLYTAWMPNGDVDLGLLSCIRDIISIPSKLKVAFFDSKYPEDQPPGLPLNTNKAKMNPGSLTRIKREI